MKPASGSVQVNGSDVWRSSARDNARAMAVLAQENTSEFELLVRDVVLMGRTPHQSPFAPARLKKGSGRCMQPSCLVGAERRWRHVPAIEFPGIGPDHTHSGSVVIGRGPAPAGVGKFFALIEIADVADDVAGLVGGTGLIGRHLIPRLLELGHHVTVSTRSPEKAKSRLDSHRLRELNVIDAACRCSRNVAAVPDE